MTYRRPGRKYIVGLQHAGYWAKRPAETLGFQSHGSQALSGSRSVGTYSWGCIRRTPAKSVTGPRPDQSRIRPRDRRRTGAGTPRPRPQRSTASGVVPPARSPGGSAPHQLLDRVAHGCKHTTAAGPLQVCPVETNRDQPAVGDGDGVRPLEAAPRVPLVSRPGDMYICRAQEMAAHPALILRKRPVTGGQALAGAVRGAVGGSTCRG